MKSISIDFVNNVICFMTDNQQGTEKNFTIKKETLTTFFPKTSQIENYSSFTWNFENNTISFNQSYDLQPGAIMTRDCFIPEVIIPMPGLDRNYTEFVSAIGYEEVDYKKDILDILKGLGW